MDRSRHYNVRGLACYSLARQLGRKANADGAGQAQRDKFNKERLPLVEQPLAGTVACAHSSVCSSVWD